MDLLSIPGAIRLVALFAPSRIEDPLDGRFIACFVVLMLERSVLHVAFVKDTVAAVGRVSDTTGVGFGAFKRSTLMGVLGKDARRSNGERGQRDEDGFVYHA